MINIYVGYDPREAVAYSVFCNSVISGSSVLPRFIPLHAPLLGVDGQRDGTNAFIYSRYLVPELNDYQGFALFCDGDMLALDDIAKLWSLRDERYAVQVVKHDYRTKHPQKYVGTPLESPNIDYPRKNWSSVMLFNCGHPSNRILDMAFVQEASGSFLHRFQWLRDDEIGELPSRWNVLIGEQQSKDPGIAHYTLGIPAFKHYEDCDWSDEWFLEYNCMRTPIRG